MKLYNVPPGTTILLEEKFPDTCTPPDHAELPDAGTLYLFGHIDGMYSFCTVLTGPRKGEIVHLKAWSEVSRVPSQ